jgi:hypothetical protein
MHRTLIAAALAALPVVALGATPFDPSGLPAHLRVPNGQSFQQALQHARFEAHWAQLRGNHGVSATALHTDPKTALPKLTSGMVVSTSLTVGQAGSNPTVEFGYKTGPSGLSFVSLIFVSPNGNESLTVDYSPFGVVTHNELTVEQPGGPSYYAQPGDWQLQAGYIADYAGNETVYSQAQLAKLFPVPYINVINNGPVDITPPTVQSGQVLTPTVSLSSPLPVFEASLTGQDDVSGLYLPYVGIEAPGGSYSVINYAPMPFPLLSGTGTAYSTVFAGQPTGTWAITFYAFCDVVGNCFSDQSPTDIQNLFGTTTFQVTD